MIPCYNAEAFVAEAVASVLQQTVPPAEIVCVDDGSTDSTLEILERLKAEHDRIKVLTGPNGGPSAARNRGLAAATGDYVQFLDADDLLDPTKLEHQLCHIRKNGGQPDLVVAGYRVHWPGGKEATIEVEDDVWAGLVEARLGITSANLWRREAVTAVGGWREGMHTSEDPELVFRLLRSGRSVLRDEACLTILRRRPDSLWNADYERSQRSWFALRREIVAYMVQAHLLTEPRRRRVARKFFEVLDSLYQKDRPLALEMHALLEGIGLDPASAGLNWTYVFAYRLGGFDTAQRARNTWRGLYWSLLGRPSVPTLSNPLL